MPRTPAEPPVGTGTARERLSELATSIGLERLDRYQTFLERLEPRQFDALIARLERAQSWYQIATVVGEDSVDDVRAVVVGALCGRARRGWPDIEEVARAIVDGSPIEWPARLNQAKDERERDILKQLRLVEEVAEACRSQSTSPKRLGDFEILRELGRGGMGVVYEARQVSLNRRVALKVLPPALGLSPQATKRFEREARAAAKLHHTNIVPVHAIGEQEGYHFYAMDVVDGQSLDHILEDASGGQANPLLEATVTRAAEELPEKASPTTTGGETSTSTSLSDSAPGGRRWFDVVVKLVAEVAEALQYAHGRGIIHRDIKPANLMLSAEGHLCVTDFGLARMLQEPGMTVSGSLLGTPAYMSPEQIAAGRVTVDHRTDVYSLGAVLYELLTLQRPFPGKSREEVLTAVLTHDPRPPRRFNGKIPVDLETICLKALEKNPERRYRTAGELAQDLRRYLQGGLIQARRAGVVRRTVKSVRRHPTAAVAVVLSIAFLMVIGGVMRLSTKREAAESTERATAQARLALTEGDYEAALAHIDDALSIDPERPDARQIRARLLIRLDRPVEAYEDAQRVLASNPDDWTAHLVLAGLAKGGWDRTRNLPTISAEEHIAFVESRAPDTADAYYLRSLAADSPTKALELLDRALSIDPVHVDSVLAKIRRLEEVKDYPAALEECDRLVLLRPKSAEIRRVRAWLNRQSGDWIGALAEMDRAIELDPDDPSNREHRARAYFALSLFEEAVVEVTRAIELNADQASYYALRARCLKKMGRYDDAILDARRSISLSPDDPSSWRVLLGAYFDSRQDDRVRETLSEFTTKAKSWGDPSARSKAHSFAALYFRNLGDTDRAVAETESALQLDPHNASALVERAKVLELTGDNNLRAQNLESASQIVHDLERSAESRLGAAKVGQIANLPDEGLSLLDRLAEDYPRWYEVYQSRGVSHIYLGNIEAAIDDWVKTTELAPGFAGGYGNLGYAHSRLGRVREALEFYEKALECNPYATQFRLNILVLLMYNGRLDEVEVENDKLIERKPRMCDGHEIRAQVLAFKGECEAAHDTVASLDDCEMASGGSKYDALAAVQLVFAYACPKYFSSTETVVHARSKLERGPGDALSLTEYGTALYLDDDYEAAKTQLLKAMELTGVERSRRVFVLSAIASKQGDSALARDYYDRACTLMDRDEPNNPWLILQRREAARLLGIEVENEGAALAQQAGK